MARSTLKKRVKASPAPPPSRLKEAAGVLVGAGGLYLFISLLTYTRLDPSLNSAASPGWEVRNAGGIVGAYLADAMLQVFGLGAYVLILLLLVAAVRTVLRRPLGIRTDRMIAYVFALLSASILVQIVLGTVTLGGRKAAAGGAVGHFMGGVLVDYVHLSGAVLFSGAVLLLAASVVTGLSVKTMGHALLKFALDLFAYAKAYRERRKLAKAHKLRIREDQKDEPRFKSKTPKIAVEPRFLPTDEISFEPPKELVDIVGGRASSPKIVKQYTAKKKSRGAAPPTPTPADGEFALPDIALLESEEQKQQIIDEAALTEAAQHLENKLKDFGIFGHVVEIHPGPVITMYEFEPAPGIKVSKISGLVDDLKMAMRAKSVRIIAPLPGKGTVGIEIPNREREIVYLKDILGHTKYATRTTPLPLALGKDISGKPTVSDLTKMPHMLIAGSTGSGKSVAVNSMLISMLYRSTPEDVRLLMIDPKMLEFTLYDGIPHLLLPVITNPKKAAMALKWAVSEMERRYRLLADIGARNIMKYNSRIPGILEERASKPPEEKPQGVPDTGEPDAKPLEHGKLPYIVIVIDELADLMLVSRNEVEESITRLAQMARAAGIHLMIATQRPSVDVLTGLIKANFPARIAFRVPSKTDSRTILDSNGAEELLGEGDMLFKSSRSFALNRIHGPLVTDAEVARVVKFLKDQGKPEYDDQILKPRNDEGDIAGDDEDVDELYDHALAVIAEHRIASISFLQRKLRVGYNRAARMIEKMEADGVVSPPEGAKGRQVLLPL